MSQVSPPLRILLVGAVLFMAVWFAALRPGGEEPAPAPAPAGNAATGAPAVSPPGKVAEAAKGAATAASGAAAERAGEAPAATAPGTAATAPSATATTGGTPAATKSTVASALPASVAKAVAANKVLVLYFWNPKALDDRAMRREVRGVDRHRGKVVVHVAKIGDIARYAPITRGAEVQQSPSVVVVGRDRTAEKLEGYHSRRAVNQAVSDALRSKK